MTASWDRCHNRHGALHRLLDDVESGRRPARIDWAGASDLHECFSGLDDVLSELEMWWTHQVSAHLDQVFEGLAAIDDDEHGASILQRLRDARPGLHAVLDAHRDAAPVVRGKRIERGLLRDAGYRTPATA